MMKVQLVLFLLILCVASSQAATLQKVALLARNGARGFSSLSDGQFTCDTCELTLSGKESSLQLGSFLLTRYSEQLSLGTGYDLNLLAVSAAAAERTIITGEGVIKGMYPESMPLVKYTTEANDQVLSVTKSWPSLALENIWGKKLHLDDSWALKKLGEGNIATLSRFLPLGMNDAWCRRSPSLCAAYVYDSWCVNASEGNKDPTLDPVLDAMKSVYKRFMWRLYGIDPTNQMDKAIGPLSGPFIGKMLQDFFSNITKVKLFINVGPMPIVFATYSSLGIFNAENTLAGNAPESPAFGEAIAFEYSGDTTHTYIQAFRFVGSTENEMYTALSLAIKCMDAKGVFYFSNSTKDGCVADDVLRYVNSLGSSGGQCYASDSVLVEANCDTDGAPPVNSTCYFYRSKCPGAQCGSIHGAIADPSRGFACQDAQLNGNAPYLAVTIVAIGAPCLLAGSIFGFYLSDRIWRLIRFNRGSTA